jgi:hypothetical protein
MERHPPVTALPVRASRRQYSGDNAYAQRDQSAPEPIVEAVRFHKNPGKMNEFKARVFSYTRFMLFFEPIRAGFLSSLKIF